MAYLITGAVVFAAGCLFGAWMILAGQQSKTSRTNQRTTNERDNGKSI